MSPHFFRMFLLFAPRIQVDPTYKDVLVAHLLGAHRHSRTIWVRVTPDDLDDLGLQREAMQQIRRSRGVQRRQVLGFSNEGVMYS